MRLTSGAAARAGGVDGLGHQLLAGAALAGDEHGFRGGGDLGNPRPQGLHPRTRADHLRRLAGPRRLRAGGLLQKPAVANRLCHQPLDLIHVEGLLDVIEGPVPHRLDRRVDGGVGGDHDHLGPVAALLELNDELQPAHPRHLQVGDDAIVALLLDDLQGLAGARAAGDAVAGLAEDVGHRLAGLAVVVDDQHAAAADTGVFFVGGNHHAAASRAR